MHWLCRRNVWIHFKRLTFSSRKLHKYQSLRFLNNKPRPSILKKEVSSDNLALKYNPKDVESHWYEWWESQDYFNPSRYRNNSFTILLPPPNVTGTLHLGHALTTTIQDVILRWKRMKGEPVLWIPGMDHAGIATQVAVEKHLSQSLGLSKHDLGKEEFVKKVLEWKEEKSMKITKQFRSLGASLDWSKLRFTMDPVHSQLVEDSFIKLYNQGLIYRNKRLVNWSCALKSSISDIEVDWLKVEERMKINVPGYDRPVDFGILYEFAYKVCDEDDEIIVSTTRPETMLGDVAIAVHPSNPVHTKYKNKKVWHPFRNEKIPIIFDDFMDRELGTGAVKITPCHSLVDFEIGLRHNLKGIEVINDEGCLHKVGSVEKFHGLKRFHGRKVIIDELKALSLFRGYKNHAMKVPICSRSGDVVEFLLKDQWFLNCQSLAEKAVKVVEAGDLKLEPREFYDVWSEWLCKIRDWNLSRQLWWGHQIPMYECTYEGRTLWVPASSSEEAKLRGSEELKASAEEVSVARDPDVLDTWFSSGLLPLGIPSAENKNPISVMVTGHDILFFWVARMVMLGIQLEGKLPFNHVLLHGLMCDSKGRKMSKSLGNVIRPEEIVNGISFDERKAELESNFRQGLLTKKDFNHILDEQKKMFPNGIPECGTDALRFTLLSNDVLNYFINFDVELCLSSKHFGNKIWQAMNYFIKIANNYKASNSIDGDLCLVDVGKTDQNLNWFDRWILSRLAAAVEAVDEGIASYKFYLATKAIRSFLVEEFCGFYLESSKSILKDASSAKYKVTLSVFFHCMETSLRMLSPFMPFLSEHLYHALPLFNGFERWESVTAAPFPTSIDWKEFRDGELDADFKNISEMVSTLRRAKITYHMIKKKPKVFVKCNEDSADILFGDVSRAVWDLAGVESMTRVSEPRRSNAIKKVINGQCVAYVEHELEKEGLLKQLGPIIGKEESVRASLEALLKQTKEPQWGEKLPAEKNRHARKIKNLQMELDNIEEFKETIENCER